MLWCGIVCLLPFIFPSNLDTASNALLNTWDLIWWNEFLSLQEFKFVVVMEYCIVNCCLFLNLKNLLEMTTWFCFLMDTVGSWDSGHIFLHIFACCVSHFSGAHFNLDDVTWRLPPPEHQKVSLDQALPNSIFSSRTLVTG